MNKIAMAIRGMIFSVIVFNATILAQNPGPSTVGPVPPAIRSAKKIFVSNAGADSGLFPEPFSGDPARGYNQFYSELNATGQYELENDPSRADLVLELQLTAPNGPTSANKQNGASDPLPMFRLVVYDQKTHFVLWALTESIGAAILQKTHDHNFDEALTAIFHDFETLSGKTAVTPP